MKVLVAIGEGPGGLGGLWRPMAWMPAIATLEARLAQEAGEGPVRVRTTLEAGFPLMAAAAALRARDAGLPVSLEVVLPHPLPDEDQEPRAILNWARRALERADARQTLFARPPRTRGERGALQQETARALLAGEPAVLACWTGGRGSRTWALLQQAQARGLGVANVYPLVAMALGLSLPAPQAQGWDQEETG